MKEIMVRLKEDTYQELRKRVTLDTTFDDVIRAAFKLPRRSKK